MTFKKGMVPWNKGKKCNYLLGNNHGKGQKLGFKHSQETKKLLSEIHRENWRVGKEKVNSGNFKKGQKPANYIDGRTKIVKIIRVMKEYLQWRADVFKRDNYHCQECGNKGYLEPHHIISFSKIVSEFNIKSTEEARKCKLLWDIGNGISYCRVCHVKNDKNIGVGLRQSRRITSLQEI